MGGITRRQMLKASAAAGGLAWAAPMLSTGAAWGVEGPFNPCTCDGNVVYAKFAPGNSQTCKNQCLQPGTATRYSFPCLVAAGLIAVCDDVSTNGSDSTASLAFKNGTSPLKLAMKATNDCYVTRCNEGFSKIYRWSSSFNAESYPDAPGDYHQPKSPDDPYYDTAHDFSDPATTPETAMFGTYKDGGTGSDQLCTGQVPGAQVPGGVLCGWTANGGQINPQACTVPVTGVFMTTAPLVNDPLAFIEMMLCITNTSKISCLPNDCDHNN